MRKRQKKKNTKNFIVKCGLWFLSDNFALELENGSTVYGSTARQMFADRRRANPNYIFPIVIV